MAASPGFTPSFDLHSGIRRFQWVHVDLDYKNLRYTDALFVFLFAWASRQQHRCFEILADLRHAQSATRYRIPRGGLFRWLSCPHFAMEILVYVSFCGVLGLGHRSGLLVLAWVATNQLVSGLNSHFWYQDNFRDYPRERRAVIPYLL